MNPSQTAKEAALEDILKQLKSDPDDIHVSFSLVPVPLDSMTLI